MSGKVLTCVIMGFWILLKQGMRWFGHLHLRSMVIGGVSRSILAARQIHRKVWWMVGVYVCSNMSNKSIKMQYGFAIKDKGREVKNDTLSKEEGSKLAPLEQ